MKLVSSITIIGAILAAATLVSFLHAKLVPTSYAYRINYYNQSCKNGISGINIFPVYGSNGTCIRKAVGHRFDFVKVFCDRDGTATVSQECMEDCTYCNDVEVWKVDKNECGIQYQGCSTTFPHLPVPQLYNSIYEYSQYGCSGNLVNIQGETVDSCKVATTETFERITCNQTMWTRSYYNNNKESNECNQNNFNYAINGPLYQCRHSYEYSMMSCGKI